MEMNVIFENCSSVLDTGEVENADPSRDRCRGHTATKHPSRRSPIGLGATGCSPGRRRLHLLPQQSPLDIGLRVAAFLADPLPEPGTESVGPKDQRGSHGDESSEHHLNNQWANRIRDTITSREARHPDPSTHSAEYSRSTPHCCPNRDERLSWPLGQRVDGSPTRPWHTASVTESGQRSIRVLLHINVFRYVLACGHEFNMRQNRRHEHEQQAEARYQEEAGQKGERNLRGQQRCQLLLAVGVFGLQRLRGHGSVRHELMTVRRPGCNDRQ